MLAGSAIATGATGFVYAWMKYLLTTDDPYAVVNHPLQPLMLKLHILAAPWLVFAIGLIFSQHVVRHWRSRRSRGRRGGLTLVVTSVPMIVSGYLIQTVTAELVLELSVWTHLATAALYLAGFALHRGRMRSAATRRSPLQTVERGGEECA
jgi:hypothetical protein